ncbi:MAG: hypothetical protein AMS17_18900, partial [Spirochaetes bacterium DG_61]
MTFFSLFSFLMVGTIAHSSDLNLSDYERLLYGRYSQYLPLLGSRSLSLLSDDLAAGPADEPYNDEVPVKVNGEEGIKTELNLEGELYLNLQYGKDFSLKKNAVVGAGSSGITSGLKYDLIERVRLEGSVADRLFVEFDYDSERSEEGLTEETNTYSLLYKGRNDEFLKEATLGNKYLSIEGSRFVPIDEGNQDSFALRALASWRDLYLDGLLRYDVATEGKKQFRGFRKNVDMQVLDVDYARGRFFFLPDIDVNEATLLLYRSTDLTGDLVVDGKEFRLLTRGVDFDFDNFTGRIYMEDDLALDEELIVYYEKGGNPVGDPALGDDAIIDSTGTRDNFDSTSFSEYFDATTTYLYLKKQSFNSYWELRNIYYLEEIEGENIYDFEIELLYTLNSGINNNYDYDDIHLLDDYEIETSRGIIL